MLIRLAFDFFFWLDFFFLLVAKHFVNYKNTSAEREACLIRQTPLAANTSINFLGGGNTSVKIVTPWQVQPPHKSVTAFI